MKFREELEWTGVGARWAREVQRELSRGELLEVGTDRTRTLADPVGVDAKRPWSGLYSRPE